MEVRTRADMYDHGEIASSNGVTYEIFNAFGEVWVQNSSPQVFLVRQGAHDVTEAHFHKVPQFQIFVEGDGALGRKVVAPPVLHYVDGWSTYGPITAGSQGIAYFTARLSGDIGAHYMPASKREKLEKSGRHFTLPLERRSLESSATYELIARADDGLGAYEIIVSAAEKVELPAQPVGSGRLVVVLDGGLTGSKQLETWSWIHVRDGDAWTQGAWAATQEGARVLVLDFPAIPEFEQRRA